MTIIIGNNTNNNSHYISNNNFENSIKINYVHNNIHIIILTEKIKYHVTINIELILINWVHL